MKKTFFYLFWFCFPLFIFAQTGEIINDKQQILLSRVVEVVSQEERSMWGTDTKIIYQSIKAEILEGEMSGKIVDIKNDYLTLKKGEKFYLMHTVDGIDGHEYFSVYEKYRLPSLFWLIGIFIFVSLFFGRLQGLRGLFSLVGSMLLIVFVLLPGILKGYSPIFMTIAVSSVIVILGSYITHGFNKTTSAAVVGMLITVVVTGSFSFLAVNATGLSGYDAEEAVYLTFNSGGNLDVVGILFGGIMIGLLGVLYDAAIGQAVAVEELWRIAPHVDGKKIYQRALRMGREHIGALVDTLAIAYVGASLPLLLLFFQSTSESFLTTLNREIFAAEIVRIMIGSIGLILAVPITTFVSVRMLQKKNNFHNKDEIAREEEALQETPHSHLH